MTTKKTGRTRYVDDRKAELGDLDKDIETASRSVDGATTESKAARDAKASLQTKLAELKTLRKEAAARIEKVHDAAEEAWEGVRDEAEHTWRALRASVNYFRSYFRNR